MEHDCTATEYRRLSRWRRAYSLAEVTAFKPFGVRGAVRLCWLRWLADAGAFDDDRDPDDSLSSSWARRFFSRLDACWHLDALP